MWLMTQQPEPDDYLLATGETHSVREFAERAFARVGREIEGSVVNKMVDANLQIAGDVTERRLIDEQLRRVQKMEAVVCKTPTQAACSFLDDAK